MRKLILFLFLTTSLVDLSAQDCSELNSTTNKSSREKIYEVGIGSSREEAIENAVEMILMRFKCTVAGGAAIQVQKIDADTQKKRYKTTVRNCENVEVFEFRVVDKCSTAAEYKVLTEIFAPNLSKAALFAIVPGAGHYYKKEPKAGTVFLASVGAMAGLTGLSIARANYFDKKISLTRDTYERIGYKDSRNRWQNVSVAFGVLTGITYGVSIAHAGFGKKNNRLYASNSMLSKLELMPFYDCYSAGFTVKLQLE